MLLKFDSKNDGLLFKQKYQSTCLGGGICFWSCLLICVSLSINWHLSPMTLGHPLPAGLYWTYQYLLQFSDVGSQKEMWMSACSERRWHLHLYVPRQWETQVAQDSFLSHPATYPSAIENTVNTFSHKLLVQEAVVPSPSHQELYVRRAERKPSKFCTVYRTLLWTLLPLL